MLPFHSSTRNKIPVKLSIQKSGNQVNVYAEVPRSGKPVFVHRVTLHWSDSHGSGVGLPTNYFRPDLFVEEGSKATVATMDIPNGVAIVRAEACHEVVEGIAKAELKF